MIPNCLIVIDIQLIANGMNLVSGEAAPNLAAREFKPELER